MVPRTWITFCACTILGTSKPATTSPTIITLITLSFVISLASTSFRRAFRIECLESSRHPRRLLSECTPAVSSMAGLHRPALVRITAGKRPFGRRVASSCRPQGQDIEVTVGDGVRAAAGIACSRQQLLLVRGSAKSDEKVCEKHPSHGADNDEIAPSCRSGRTKRCIALPRRPSVHSHVRSGPIDRPRA
jgi:hypothetical protein